MSNSVCNCTSPAAAHTLSVLGMHQLEHACNEGLLQTAVSASSAHLAICSVLLACHCSCTQRCSACLAASARVVSSNFAWRTFTLNILNHTESSAKASTESTTCTCMENVSQFPPTVLIHRAANKYFGDKRYSQDTGNRLLHHCHK